MTPLGVLLLLCTTAVGVHAQGIPPTRAIRGVALTRDAPVSGINIFDLETLVGMITAADGRFFIAIPDAQRKMVRIAARAVGYSPVDTIIALTGDTAPDSIIIRMKQLATLVPISVMAGRYTATAERTATLTPIEVANTPGSNADISGAIKTLPGVQNVDEGSGLFVRGGDFTETRMFVDGAPLFSAYQFEAPTGSVAGTINPFLTSSITFSSGGFGAEWGNALSGVVDLRTQARSPRSFMNVNASILGLSVGGTLALPHGISVSTTVGATDLRAMLKLSGNPRGFEPAPQGRSASGLAVWDYRRTGTLKLFALTQKNAFGVPVVEPALTTTFASDRQSDVVVASWSDSIGRWRPFASVSTSGFSRDEGRGTYQQTTSLRSTQARVTSQLSLHSRASLTFGAEVERLAADYTSQLPANQYDPSDDAPVTRSRLNSAATREALFVSVDTRPTSATEFIAGARSSRSGFGTQRHVDPRLSFAWVPRSMVTLMASWGVYHQTVDPAFLDRLVVGARVLPELQSSVAILGMQLGEERSQLRLEVWTKRYQDLVALTRSYATVADLGGRARGSDLFFRTSGPWKSNVRLTYSLSASRRTDPNTGLDAPAPFDITSSITLVMQKEWSRGWSGGAAYKHATGRPFTDVSGASLDLTRGVYVPSFAAPFGERLPTFNRLDLSVSKQKPFGANRFAVVFAGINNAVGVRKVVSYTWSADYSQRLSVPSATARTFFIGANLTLLRP